MRKMLSISIALCLCVPGIAWAGEADAIDVQVEATGDRTYRFDVTVAHADKGWEHYADAWDVLAPDGTVLGTRVLHHPHVTEQPFTRSMSVEIPSDIDRVTLRARDSVHEYGGKTVEMQLP